MISSWRLAWFILSLPGIVIFLSNFIENSLQKVCDYVKLKEVENDKKITIYNNYLFWRKEQWQEK